MAYRQQRESLTVLVCGAQGFLGSNIVRVLELRGHRVVRGVRHASPDWHDARPPHVHMDFAHDHDPQGWHERLRGIQVVINAVGILREHGAQRFEPLHVTGPLALFQACVDVGVDRVIQISALGADDSALTAYHRSKCRADEALLALPLNSVVVQPSLVFGAQGMSTQLFAMLASLPITPLPGDGEQLVQPVHVDDLALAVALLAERSRPRRERMAIVGPQAIGLRHYLALLRAGMGLAHAPAVTVPEALMDAAARWGRHRPNALLDEDSWTMLKQDNTSNDTALTQLLGHSPRAPAQFIETSERRTVAQSGQLAWLLPLLRLSLAVVWFTAGVVSMGLFPVEQSLAMLARVGAGPALAPWLLFGAAGLNILLGLATLWWARRRLWVAQAALVLMYTAVITLFLPEQWLHPFGPLVKNGPILAVLLCLYVFEECA
jgi:nucleoside-diphosphate-sugar epimerase/uncharacterized membrane protein YphA (DoxX/SURF4 family)